MRDKKASLIIWTFMIILFLTTAAYARAPIDNDIVDGIWKVKIVLLCNDFEEGKFKVKLFKNKTLMDLQYQDPSQGKINPGEPGYIPPFAITTFFVSKKKENTRKVGDGEMFFDFPYNLENECDGTNICFDGETRVVDGWIEFDHSPNNIHKFRGKCLINFTGIIKEVRKRKSKIKANTIGYCWQDGAVDTDNVGSNTLAGACSGKIKAKWKRLRINP
jgi:hypothetical protein